jgi:hypothetical protein
LDLDRIVADLKRERDRLSRAIAELEGSNSSRAVSPGAASRARTKGKKRAGLTPEGRKRLSLAMKKRWAERRKKAL